MEIKLIWKQACAAAIECVQQEIYELKESVQIFLNGEFYKESQQVISMIYGLKPDTEYEVCFRQGSEEAKLHFKTKEADFVYDVRAFGAKGDGISDDTKFIQAAIMSCMPGGRVVIPEGTYKITSLFLKSDLIIELQKGAVLSADTDREKFPVLEGKVYKEDEELILGTWEGDPMDMFAGIISGIGVKNVVIYGEGTIDGNASKDNWWYEAKKIRIAARPRMLFLNRCEDVCVAGITIKNSPSWNIHPFFSKNLRFIGVSILGPKDSPNTDGLNPESCDNVEILGCYFSVGDDCIAVKSGKISIGAKYKVPSSNIMIRQCCMRDGHGSITLGSEMAGGVRNLTAKECCFYHTDRGLRIKTRRGRGKDAIIDGIVFEDIKMDSVLTPFVVNSFYFCDPDGHTEYVQCKDPLPVDDKTPSIESLCFRNIQADNCHIAGTFFYGLPEKKIKYLEMKNVNINYAKEAQSGQPAMMDGIDENICKMGVFAKNVERLVFDNVNVEGQEGKALLLEGIDELID